MTLAFRYGACKNPTKGRVEGTKEVAGLDRTLAAITKQAGRLEEVRKEELDFGDWVVVTTLNSTYSIRVLEGNLYSISGGWFDSAGLSPLRTTITGCTWGGSAIKLDIVAACGLHLEFGNRVVTSAIRKVCVVRFGGEYTNN